MIYCHDMSYVRALEEALKPFARFGDAYPRPRIAVAASDTVIVSSGDAQITLADLDRAYAALASCK